MDGGVQFELGESRLAGLPAIELTFNPGIAN
jgi:hypothetical protein